MGDLIRVQKQNNSWQLTQVPAIEGALIALNPQDGSINALVGGFDFRRSKFNRVTQAQRQPGSGFKPFIYAAALAKGYTLASEFNDAPIVFTIPGQAALWRPQNDDHTFRGPTRLRVALANSVNVVAVRVLQTIGVPYTINYATRFGFDSKQLPRNLSLALGTAAVTPLEMARAYAVFANGGYRVTPYLIDHITDNGKTIYQAQPKTACSTCTDDTVDNDKQYAPRVIPIQTAFLMTSALQDVIRYGTGAGAQVLERADLAGKTGTTQDWVDTWFNGFNSDLVATAWIGFDQPNSLHEFGSAVALPMWIDFMRVALQNKPEHTMEQPSGITTVRIDPITGLLASDNDPGAILEYFRTDNTPQQTAPPATATAANPSDNKSNAATTNTSSSPEPIF